MLFRSSAKKNAFPWIFFSHIISALSLFLSRYPPLSLSLPSPSLSLSLSHTLSVSAPLVLTPAAAPAMAETHPQTAHEDEEEEAHRPGNQRRQAQLI